MYIYDIETVHLDCQLNQHKAGTKSKNQPFAFYYGPFPIVSKYMFCLKGVCNAKERNTTVSGFCASARLPVTPKILFSEELDYLFDEIWLLPTLFEYHYEGFLFIL